MGAIRTFLLNLLYSLAELLIHILFCSAVPFCMFGSLHSENAVCIILLMYFNKMSAEDAGGLTARQGRQRLPLDFNRSTLPIFE